MLCCNSKRGENVTTDYSEAPTGEFEVEPNVVSVDFDYLIRLRAMLTQLERRTDIEVLKSEIYDPVPDIVVELAESGSGQKIPPQILSLYKLFDGFDLEWRYLGEGGGNGKIELHGLATVFGTWTNTIWGNVVGDEPEKVDFSWQLRGLDGAWCEEDGYQTVFHVAGCLPDFSLYLYDPSRPICRLLGPLADYLERLLETAGLRDWALLWSDINFAEDQVLRERAMVARQTLIRIFPDVGMEPFASLGSEGAR
jgi:hypothetical protein